MMKKSYVTPTVEKVEFQYDKVVAASDPYRVGDWSYDPNCKGYEQPDN